MERPKLHVQCCSKTQHMVFVQVTVCLDQQKTKLSKCIFMDICIIVLTTVSNACSKCMQREHVGVLSRNKIKHVYFVSNCLLKWSNKTTCRPGTTAKCKINKLVSNLNDTKVTIVCKRYAAYTKVFNIPWAKVRGQN